MTVSTETLGQFRREVEDEWHSNIAPFWLRYAPDEIHGGFHGWIGNDLRIDEQAEKGIILNSRILWTFSHAFSLYHDVSFRQIAERAYTYLTRHFLDHKFGGVFWTLDYLGEPLDTRKRSYAQAFALYGLTEFYWATRKQAALDRAFELFDLLECRGRDRRYDGYCETFNRDWSLASDQRLSEVDQDEKKSMNSHLHVLEAYTTLARVTGNAHVKRRLGAIIDLFLKRILNLKTFHLRMFFDEDWTSKSDHISFGHDIEGSWLLCEAAEVFADVEVSAEVKAVAVQMAQAVYDQAIHSDGSLLYEAGPDGITNNDREWWVQTEAVVGFVNAYRLSGEEKFLLAARKVWQFIKKHMVDKAKGEWFWRVSDDGLPVLEMPKVSQWKCPYHNGRMSFEVISRLH